METTTGPVVTNRTARMGSPNPKPTDANSVTPPMTQQDVVNRDTTEDGRAMPPLTKGA